jgi:hypothetical protein
MSDKPLSFWRSSNFWIAGATIVIAATTIAYTCISHKQWCAMEQAVNATNRQIDMEQRPWMALDDKSGGGITAVQPYGNQSKYLFEVKDNRGYVTLEYKLENWGHSPARVLIEAEIVKHGQFQGKELSDELNRLCAQGKTEMQSNPRIWTVIPDSPMPYDVQFDGGKSDSFAEHMPPAEIDPYDPKAVLSNIGCIFYQDISSGEPHQTPFIALLTVDDPAHPVLSYVFTIGDAN